MLRPMDGGDTAGTAVRLDILLAVWLAASPLLLGFASRPGPMWNDVAIGTGTLASILALARQERVWLGYASLMLGLWAMLSPWVIGFTHSPLALWDNVIVGIMLGAVGILRIR